MIETLDVNDPATRGELVDALGGAFEHHPMMPADPTGRRPRRMIRMLLGTFDKAPDAQAFGIRRDGKLACAAFVHAYGYEPGKLAMARMLIGMARIVGVRALPACLRVMSYQRECDDRKLELLLLGTLESHQHQGLGRAMMRHVFDFARQKQYETVVLEVARDTPAMGFYQSEGYTAVHEAELNGMALSWMRRPV